MRIYTKGVNFLCKKKIKKVFDQAINFLHIEEEVEVYLTFVDEGKIRELNKKHRNVDKVTDVLSFPMLNIKPEQSLKEFKDNFFSQINLGDIVICTKKARAQAKEFGHSYSREIAFLALHGLLHLLGYDHIEQGDERIMMSTAEEILSLSGLRRD